MIDRRVQNTEECQAGIDNIFHIKMHPHARSLIGGLSLRCFEGATEALRYVVPQYLPVSESYQFYSHQLYTCTLSQTLNAVTAIKFSDQDKVTGLKKVF